MAPFVHITVLSNFARGFDKYRRVYAKSAIPESTFPTQSFVLPRDECGTGVAKASRLLTRLGIPGDALIAIECALDPAILRSDHSSGVGAYLPSGDLPVERVALVDASGALTPLRIEEAYARSLALQGAALVPWAALAPRTVSYLPVARACQASCHFCFSGASVSKDQRSKVLPAARLDAVLAAGAARGAERFVITGGGEPGLVPHSRLVDVMARGARALGKTVLITNGVHLARANEATRRRMLLDYAEAGLSVLAVSRHHHDEARNAAIMALDTGTGRVAASIAALRAAGALNDLRFRAICVLQHNGIEDRASLEAYLTWAAAAGVDEVCYKELYVSSTIESVYHDETSNEWSYAHQVPLRLVLDVAAAHGWPEVGALPWGAPLFEGVWNDRRLRIAAYTEPSPLWERSHGVARSWNLMSDGRVLASLEDRASVVSIAEEDRVALPELSAAPFLAAAGTAR